MTGRTRRVRQKQVEQTYEQEAPYKINIAADNLINAMVGGAVTAIVTLSVRKALT